MTFTSTSIDLHWALSQSSFSTVAHRTATDSISILMSAFIFASNSARAAASVASVILDVNQRINIKELESSFKSTSSSTSNNTLEMLLEKNVK